MKSYVKLSKGGIPLGTIRLNTESAVPLHYANRTIVVISAILEQAVSMKAGDGVIQLVVNGKDESVAEVQVDGRRRPLAVDPDDPSLVGAIRIRGCVRDIPLQRPN